MVSWGTKQRLMSAQKPIGNSKKFEEEKQNQTENCFRKVEMMEMEVHTLCFTQLNCSTIN
jgi:hypothetical protein